MTGGRRGAESFRGAAAVAAALLLALAGGAAGVDLSGYFEHSLLAERIDGGGESLYDASKLRLDFAAGGGRGEMEFRGNLNVVHRHGGLRYDLRPLLPDETVRELEAAGAPAEILWERSRVVLDNAFATWRGGSVRIRAGRQQLSWGPGYAYNPTDLFHVKDPADPNYEKEGVDAIRVDYRWGVGGQITAIVVPGRDVRRSGAAIRAGTHLEAIGTDWAITAHRVIDTLSFDPESLAPRSQRRIAVGWEWSGPLFGLGWWCEGNWNRMEIEEDFVRVVAGADYTFSGGSYLQAEFLYNGRSRGDAPFPAAERLAGLLYGEPVGPGWGMVSFRKEVGALASGRLTLFASPDGGFLFNPRYDYSVAENADLTLYGLAAAGNDDGPYSPGVYTLFTRLTLYF